MMPHVGTSRSAGMDLRCPIDLRLDPGCETGLISLGVAVEIPQGCVGIIAPRSSMANADNLQVLLKNTIGIIDDDYRGQLKCRLRNLGTSPLLIYRGDRFLQLVVVPIVSPYNFLVVDELSETARGAGGFGSTGVS